MRKFVVPTAHRVRSILGLALATVVLGAALAAAQTPVTVAFDPPDGQFECDQTLVVAITVDAAATDLRGFSLELQYDDGVVEPIAVDAGSLLTGAGCDHFLTWLNPDEDGTVAIDGATLGCSVTGPGTIATIEFAGVADGTSSLACLSGTLRDGVNAPIAHTCVPGTLTYACPVPVAPTGWSELKAIYR
jgi:hypothetical protein